ncbi:MAG: hypothetical protein ACRD22_13095, partial [Terriglobia bacterium]
MEHEILRGVTPLQSRRGSRFLAVHAEVALLPQLLLLTASPGFLCSREILLVQGLIELLEYLAGIDE